MPDLMDYSVYKVGATWYFQGRVVDSRTQKKTHIDHSGPRRVTLSQLINLLPEEEMKPLMEQLATQVFVREAQLAGAED